MNDDYIALDWGSTHLRAWLFRQGVCRNNCHLKAGITQLNNRHPRDILRSITDEWAATELPVLMAGMVGSQSGWVNTPYQPCLVTLETLGQHLMAVDKNVWVVPGLSLNEENAVNILRGEETQLLGAWRLQPASLYVMPGTHCKWVRVEQGCVMHFTTVITGELHHILMQHSLIGKGLPEQVTDESAFLSGVQQALKNKALLPKLFELRAGHILGNFDASVLSERLSGMLIGAEISQMQHVYDVIEHTPVTLVGSDFLTARYQLAMQHAGIAAHIVSGDAAFLQGIRSMINELV